MLRSAGGQTCDQSKSLNAIKVGVLNGHDTSVRKDLLREVVDELAVDKAVEALTDDVLHFGAHLLLLCLLYVCHLQVTVLLHTLVCITLWTKQHSRHSLVHKTSSAV